VHITVLGIPRDGLHFPQQVSSLSKSNYRVAILVPGPIDCYKYRQTPCPWASVDSLPQALPGNRSRALFASAYQAREPPKIIGLTFFNRLLGGWKEETSIEYDPKDRKFRIGVSQYTERGVPPEEVGEVEEKIIGEERQVEGVEFDAFGTVEQNPATDEFVGTSWAITDKFQTKDPKVLKKVFDKLFDETASMAEQAEEELIKYRGEKITV